METAQNIKEQPKQQKSKPILKKIDAATAKSLSTIRERVNKKSFGRKIKEREILALAVRQISDSHIKEMQESTLTQQDRLHLAHEEYVKANGRITLDDFIGRLMRGEISQNTMGVKD